MVNRDTENTARTLVADGKGHLYQWRDHAGRDTSPLGPRTEVHNDKYTV